MPQLYAEIFFLTCGYVQCGRPEYFVDEDASGVVWQPDVYPYTLNVAQARGRNTITDLRCGRAAKLVALRERFPGLGIVGVDFGPNIEWCRGEFRHGQWIEADLETATTLPLDASVIADSVIVCSDVLEHLVDPRPTMRLITWLLGAGAARAVLSTPARDQRVGADDLGPPRNPSHVREWTCAEFQAFVRSCHLEIEHFELTRSDDSGGGLTTQLALVRLPRAEP